MSLEWYRRPHLVVLQPDAPLTDAARAIEQNRIGAVVVQDRGRVVGILTDRDLVVRTLGLGHDPRTIPIRDAMTSEPVTLAPSDTVMDAVRAMRDAGVRRVPLVEEGRCVGIVTLDDLLLDEAAPLEDLAAVIQQQITERPASGSVSIAAWRRGIARAEATFGRFVRAVREASRLPSRRSARVAAYVVLSNIARRLTPQEANDFIDQLPSLLQADLRDLPAGPDKTVTAAAIVNELSDRLDLDSAAAANVLAAVVRVAARSVSAGEIRDVRGQLPADLGNLFTVSGPEPVPA